MEAVTLTRSGAAAAAFHEIPKDIGDDRVV